MTTGQPECSVRHRYESRDRSTPRAVQPDRAQQIRFSTTHDSRNGEGWIFGGPEQGWAEALGATRYKGVLVILWNKGNLLIISIDPYVNTFAILFTA
jgi:hypothetical protein